MNIVTVEKPFVFKVVDFRSNTIDTWCFDSEDKCRLAYNNWRKTALKEFIINRTHSSVLGFVMR